MELTAIDLHLHIGCPVALAIELVKSEGMLFIPTISTDAAISHVDFAALTDPRAANQPI